MENIFYTFCLLYLTASGNIESTLEKKSEIEISIIQNKLSSLENLLISEYKKSETNPDLAKNFAEIFLKKIKENPESLNYTFKKLQEETPIYIATSTDKKLRFYSWDNNTGGTMRFFDQIVQFSDNGKINSTLKTANEDAQSFVSKIYSIKTNKKETIYLTINNAIYSNKDASQSIFAYKISNNKLVATKAFKTKKQSLSSIHCEFDFFSVIDRPERPVELIILKNNILYIPLINQEGVVTKKNLLYKWNGLNFNYNGIK